MDKLVELVEKLREAARGVTPGPWAVYDGCSWRRIGTAWGRRDDCAVLAPTKASDGHPDLTVSAGNDREANLAWIALCSPDNILPILDALASQAVREQALEEARQAIRDVLNGERPDFVMGGPAAIVAACDASIRALKPTRQREGLE